MTETLDLMGEEDYIVNYKTAKLAELIVEYAWNDSAWKQEEKYPVIINECYPCGDAVERDSSGTEKVVASEEESQAAKDAGIMLRKVAQKYDKELAAEFASRIGALIKNVTYNAFSSMCSGVLRTTCNQVGSRWDQTLLVLASYARIREALQGDTLRQNETAMYIGRYLKHMGFDSWISWIRHQDSSQNVGQICPGAQDLPICPRTDGI